MAEICLKRRALREQIRHQHIHQHLSQQRALFFVSPPQQARELLIQALSGIKSTIEDGCSFDTKPFLRQYRLIAQKYQVCETLVCEILFNYELAAVQMGLLPLECTWAGVFLYLTQIESNSDVQQELLKILAINTYQLRILSRQMIVQVPSILKQTIKKVPLHWCSNKVLWVDMCHLLGELFVSAQLLGVQVDLLQKQSGVIQFLERMSNDHVLKINLKARQVLVEVSLFALTLIDKEKDLINTVTLPLRRSITTIILQNFENGWLDFDKNCEYFRRLLLAGEQADLQLVVIIGQYLSEALGCNSSKYFELLNTIMFVHKITLNTQFFRQVSNFVFRDESLHEEQAQTVEMKKWMVLILKRQLENSSDPQEDMKIILEDLFQNTGTLPKVLQTIKIYDQTAYDLIVQLIMKILNPLCSTHQIPQRLRQLLAVCPVLQQQINELNPTF